MDSDKKKSVYRYGGEYGRYMGIYFIVMSACLLASPRVAGLFLVMAALLPVFPYLLYRFLKKIYRDAPYLRSFSALWTGGIMITICGCLICSLVTALWLIYVQPNFFSDYLRMAIEAVQASGQAAEYKDNIELMQTALDKGVVPTAFQFILSMIWSTVLLGSIISMACAWALMASGRRRLIKDSGL